MELFPRPAEVEKYKEGQAAIRISSHGINLAPHSAGFFLCQNVSVAEKISAGSLKI